MPTPMTHLRGDVQYVLICLAEVITHCGQNDIKYVKGKHLHSNSKTYLLLNTNHVQVKVHIFCPKKGKLYFFLFAFNNIQCMGI